MNIVQSSVVWAVTAIAIAGMLFRPWRLAEWVWAGGGAATLIVLRVISPTAAGQSILRGLDVYAFLVGILLLAELARCERLFDYLASHALTAARGSQRRLFGFVFAAGVVVTALLSNDTTIVVLTPAVMAVLARSNADPLPYLYACAFVANAASFVLPVSNPANLVVLDGHLPPLLPWIRAFGLAAVAALALTFLSLRLAVGVQLRPAIRSNAAPVAMDRRLRRAFVAIGVATAILTVGAALGLDIGYVALGVAVAATAALATQDHQTFFNITKHFPWQIVPLVAGLFVIVGALDATGTLSVAAQFFTWASHSATPGKLLALGGVLTIACNLLNNLPVGVAAGHVLTAGTSSAVAHATVAAIDLGPNLTVTGSLATLLWTMILRREGIEVTPLRFLLLGLVVTLPALAATMLLVS